MGKTDVKYRQQTESSTGRWKKPESGRHPLVRLFRSNVRTYAMVIGWIVLAILFTIATDGLFVNVRNLSNLVRQMAIFGILGTGMILVIVSGNGNIDLAAGSVLGFVGGVAAALIIGLEWQIFPAILVALTVGLVIGLAQGFTVTRLQVPAFIVTLGGMMLYRGANFIVLGGVTVAPFPDAYRGIAEGHISPAAGLILALIAVVVFALILANQRKSHMRYDLRHDTVRGIVARTAVFGVVVFGFVLLMNAHRGVHVPVVVLIALVLVMNFISTGTKFGRDIYAVGGNIEAAEYAGIKTRRIVTMVFMLNGLIAAMAGIVYSARLNAATPDAGETMELDAIAAAIIGGASLSGGAGAVPGAILGAVVLATLDNGLSLLNANVFWQLIVKGVVVIVAVWFDSYTSRKLK